MKMVLLQLKPRHVILSFVELLMCKLLSYCASTESLISIADGQGCRVILVVGS